ncbi:PepSY domain-containing protein [Thermaurantiacus sp.]
MLVVVGAGLAAATPAPAQSPGLSRPGEAGPSAVPRGYPRWTQQDAVLHDTRRGRQVPFPDLVDRAVRAAGGGQYLGAENEPGSETYRVKVMRADGSVAWVDINGRTGLVLRVRG